MTGPGQALVTEEEKSISYIKRSIFVRGLSKYAGFWKMHSKSCYCGLCSSLDQVIACLLALEMARGAIRRGVVFSSEVGCQYKSNTHPSAEAWFYCYDFVHRKEDRLQSPDSPANHYQASKQKQKPVVFMTWKWFFFSPLSNHNKLLEQRKRKARWRYQKPLIARVKIVPTAPRGWW